MDNNQNQKYEKSGWKYVSKGMAIAVVGGGVCATAILLKEPAALLGLILVAAIASWME